MTKHSNLYQIIILAAGKGSRMKSDLPKVMHKVGSKPMIERVIQNALEVSDDIILVHSDELLDYLGNFKQLCKFALQKEQLGTAHAVHAALELIDATRSCAVIYGDNPFISSDIIHELLTHLEQTKSAVTTLCFERDDPGAYGRIVTDEAGNFEKIVEYKCASEAEKKITLCNSGVMAFAPGVLNKYIPHCLTLGNEALGKAEFYLTDIIEICKNAGARVSYLLSSNAEAVIGVNTQEELKVANVIAKDSAL